MDAFIGGFGARSEIVIEPASAASLAATSLEV